VTETLTPERGTESRSTPKADHYHPSAIAIGLVGLVLAFVAVAIAIGAVLMVPEESQPGSRNNETVAPVDNTVSRIATGNVVPDLVPKAELQVVPAEEVNVSYAPNVPPPSGRTEPGIVEVEFEVVENVSAIDPETGVEYETWGYRLVGDDSNVSIGTPGPMVRGRVGDILRFTITNAEGNTHPHNVDFHAVTGQGGGATNLVVAPGESRTIEARLLYPGFFMYHCAYDDVPLHISHGMYGGILVDPVDPLPSVDHEWYVVQSEYYTDATDAGLVGTDRQAITDEMPSYVVFNGATGAIAGDNALQMDVGQRARIYFVNAGLNLDSNFHPIGSHWDVVYQEASLLSEPVRGSQTTLVPAGGGVVVELIGQVPSTILLVDHALARTFDKGALGQVVVSGDPNTEIFEEVGIATSNSDPEEETAAPAGIDVSILAGSSTTQALDAADEFADSETPADYSQNVLTVSVGTSVRWTNEDTVIHTVTGVDGGFDSGFLGQGDTWSFTFDRPGEYEYYCLPHPWMRAKVVVEG
jgi:nitrite reductase (NO-forming)